MKTAFRIVVFLLLTVLIFGLNTVLTQSIEYPADGDNTYGYPFMFYIKYSGMCAPTPECSNQSDFFIWNLIGDVLFAAVIALMVCIGVGLAKRLKNSKHQSDATNADLEEFSGSEG